MDIPTAQEIPPESWCTFLDVFGRRCEGWIASLVVFDSSSGAYVETCRLPLCGVVGEAHGTRKTICVFLGAAPTEHVAHEIARPARLRFLRSEGERGATEMLVVDEVDGRTTLVRLDTPNPQDFM